MTSHSLRSSLSDQSPPTLSCAVEGLTDRLVVERLAKEVGCNLGTVYGLKGKDHLLKRLPSYQQAANFAPWAVLIDLDEDFDCAPSARAAWLTPPGSPLYLAIVVRKLEAWLLADRERAADFFGLKLAQLPEEPEAVADPKALLLDLAARSRRREIRRDLVPTARGGRREGVAFSSRLGEFASGPWRPDAAAARCPSLARLLGYLRSLSAEHPI